MALSSSLGATGWPTSNETFRKMSLGVSYNSNIGVSGAHMKAQKLLYGMLLLFMKFSCWPDFLVSLITFPRNKSVPDFLGRLPPKVKIITNHQIFLWSAFLSEMASFALCQTLRLLYQRVKESDICMIPLSYPKNSGFFLNIKGHKMKDQLASSHMRCIKVRWDTFIILKVVLKVVSFEVGHPHPVTGRDTGPCPS